MDIWSCYPQLKILTLSHLGDALALTGVGPAGAAPTTLHRQLLALVHLGAVCSGVAFPGLLLAVMLNTEAGCWTVSS